MGHPPLPDIACTASMYTRSTSGRSSRSTLTLTKARFISSAVSGSSNDSWAMTWHQWQEAYPTERSTGTSRARASAKASGPHSNQWTGLAACCSRYGLEASPRRFRPGTGRDYEAPRPGEGPASAVDDAIGELVDRIL